ncbi:KilA-N domain-containing protein [Enterobacter cloacae complex sp. P16RS2]|nr:KilA-N domain-containing protein [Enterobacter cloacae complex sp. P16RS2]MBE4892644.1 KilA-N domain-containing protein [Enterobacter cloacae complex sp. P16RS2]
MEKNSVKNNTNKHQNVSSVDAENLPVIAGVEITTDDAGRFNLNALHKASGVGEDKSPSQWLRRKSTKELIEELKRNLLKECQNVNLHSAQKPIDTANGGIAPGTFAHELLAIEYAGWISPAFRLQVNQTFLDFRAGKLAPVNSSLPDFNNPAAAARAWADEYEAKNKAIGYVHRQDQYIEHLENLFQPGMTPFQFCKQLNGVNVQQINTFLADHNWLYDERPESRKASWRVKHYARDLYLTEKHQRVAPEDAESFDAYKPVLKRKGAIWLYRHYLKGNLPMKQGWDGKFTHDIELAGAA